MPVSRNCAAVLIRILIAESGDPVKLPHHRCHAKAHPDLPARSQACHQLYRAGSHVVWWAVFCRDRFQFCPWHPAGSAVNRSDDCSPASETWSGSQTLYAKCCLPGGHAIHNCLTPRSRIRHESSLVLRNDLRCYPFAACRHGSCISIQGGRMRRKPPDR